MEPNERKVDPIQGEIVHEYDGILEADNRLPRWWLTTFYGAIAFALVYWLVVHTFGASPLPRAAYLKALEAESRSQGKVNPEALKLLAKDPARVKSGQAVFQSQCAACHGDKGEGKIGPNLTDAYWLHGHTPEGIYETINKGQTSKGMPAWGPVLGAKKVQSLTAYVLSIQNTNLPGKKPGAGAAAPAKSAGAATSAKPASSAMPAKSAAPASSATPRPSTSSSK